MEDDYTVNLSLHTTTTTFSSRGVNTQTVTIALFCP